MTPEPSSSSVDLEAREIHDWVTKYGYLNAPMSERARRCIECLQADLEHTRQIIEAQAEVVKAARTDLEHDCVRSETCTTFVCAERDRLVLAVMNSLARLDAADVRKKEMVAR